MNTKYQKVQSNDNKYAQYDTEEKDINLAIQSLHRLKVEIINNVYSMYNTEERDINSSIQSIKKLKRTMKK